MGRPGEGSGDGRARTRRRSLGVVGHVRPDALRSRARCCDRAPRCAPKSLSASWERSKELSGQFSVCRFLGPLEPQVVITRIAVRHDHHLAPSLLERRSRRRQGRARRRPPPHPRRQRRTSRGRPRGRRKVRGSRREDVDDLATQPRPAARQRRRDGGIGKRRGGEGCDEEGDEAEESPSHEGAMRARGEVSVALQVVQRLSPREKAL